MGTDGQAAIRERAREMARSGRFAGWRVIEIDLRFIEGVRAAAGCFTDKAFRSELDALCRSAQKALGIPSVQVSVRTVASVVSAPADAPAPAAEAAPAVAPEPPVENPRTAALPPPVHHIASTGPQRSMKYRPL